MMCETGTLLIRTIREIIQAQTARFCRVSYIGHSCAQTWRLTNGDRTEGDSAHFKRGRPEIRRPHEQDFFIYVWCPNVCRVSDRPPKLAHVHFGHLMQLPPRPDLVTVFR